MYKIVFFDLDGTLLNDKKEVLEENKQAIANARENGIEVVLCSGRQKISINRYRDMANTGRYIICVNGAEIYDFETDEELFAYEIDKDICKYIFDICSKDKYFLRIDTKYARYLNNIKYALYDESEIDDDMENFLNENQILQISVGLEKKKMLMKSLKN